MRGLQIRNNTVINIAVFDELPSGWVAAPDGVGIGWIDNGDGSFSAPTTPVIPIEDVADSARDILRVKCKTSITTIFQSNALSTQHSYDCRTEDQANIRTRLEASKIDTVSRKVWTHDGIEFTRTLHTTAQLEQLIVDMESHIELQQAKLETLINNVNAIETDSDRSYETKLSDIQAIAW